MSTRILDMANRYITKRGPKGRGELIKKMGVHRETLRRWLREGIPNAHDAYKLALACGCTEEEALTLASEELREAKRA